MAYNPEREIDYTNTNPDYWAGVKEHFDKPGATNDAGETGIWIPNLEKEGAEATALAAVSGGVKAYSGTNYARSSGTDPTDTPGSEKAIRLAGTHRGGVLTDTGYAMGSTAPAERGVYLKGGKVVKGAGGDYVKGGGDFGGLLGLGTAINTSMLDGLLGPRDSDGMRIRGTAPGGGGVIGGPTGAATSDPSVGGGMGVYGGGGISGGGSVVPTYMSDWSKFMPKDFSLGEAMYDTGGKEVAPGGFLYQPHAADYLGGMSRPGGMLGGGGGYGGMLGGAPSGPFTGTGGAGPAVTYTGTPGGFSMGSITPAAVGGSAGLRDGMTPGMHSSHLGAYARGDGTWVWGERPGGESGYGDPEAASHYGDPDHPDAGSWRGPIGALFGTSRAGFEAGSAARGAAAGGFGVADGHSADGDVEGMGEFE